MVKILTTHQILSAGAAGCYAAVDVIIVRNAAFRPAFERLTKMVNAYAAGVLMSDLVAYYLAFYDESRWPAILGSAPPRAIPPMIVTLLHLETGTPLFLSDELLNAWAREGLETIAECSRCGYRMPASYSRCAVCGGRTGEGGIWAKTRARFAWLN